MNRNWKVPVIIAGCLTCLPAFANPVDPTPLIVLTIFLAAGLITGTIVLFGAGGGFTVIAQEKRPPACDEEGVLNERLDYHFAVRFIPLLLLCLIILSVFGGFVFIIGLVILVFIAFSILCAPSAAGLMLIWAIRARFSKTWPPHLKDVSPRRLLAAAAALFVLEVVVLGAYVYESREFSRNHRVRAFESTGPGNIRTVIGAQTGYQSAHNRYAATFEDLTSTGDGPAYLLGEWPVGVVRNGYKYEMTGSQDGSSFQITADPVPAGFRHFYSDETGIIRSTHENRPANNADPPIGIGE